MGKLTFEFEEAKTRFQYENINLSDVLRTLIMAAHYGSEYGASNTQILACVQVGLNDDLYSLLLSGNTGDNVDIRQNLTDILGSM